MSIPIIDTLNTLGDFPAVNASDVQVGNKRLNVVLSEKADTSSVNSSMLLKADKTYVDNQLSLKANTSSVEEVSNSVSELEDRISYVTPQMYGAKGDGVTDDTTAFKNMITNLNGRYVSLPKSTYALSDTIDLTGVIFFGNRSILDFTNCTASNCITASNKAVIKDLTIQNGDKITGYGLYLDYFANGAIISNVSVKNCTNGIYLAASWYASFRDVIVQNKENSGKCITFGSSSKRSSEINSVTFDNVSMQKGEYGLYCSNTVLTSIIFNNITAEYSSKRGLKFESTSRGSIAFNALYCEHVAESLTENTEGILIDASDDMFITLQNMLIRGAYNQNPRPKLMKGKITCMPRLYNAATGADLGPVDRVISLDDMTYKCSIPEQSLYFGSDSELKIPIICDTQTNLSLQIKLHFRGKNDTTQNAFVILNVYLDVQTSNPSIVVTENEVMPKYIGGNFTASYEISATSNYKTLQTITISNSNSGWISGSKWCFVSGTTYMESSPRIDTSLL